MKNILVTGAGGYIGTVLVKQLLDAGHSVVGVDRYFFGQELLGADVLANRRFKLYRQDLRQLSERDFKDVDVVMDLAGLSNDPTCDLDPEITRKINYLGSLNAAKAAKAARVPRYIYSSSCSVYGEGEEQRLTETSPMRPVSAYAQAKVDSEKSLSEMAGKDFSVSILRNATVYGYSNRMRFDLVINMMTLYAWRNKKIFIVGGGKQWRPVVHVADVARAFVATMNAPVEAVNHQVFNVGSNEQNFQVLQIANAVRNVLTDTEVVMVPSDDDKRTYNVAFDKIAECLNFKVSKTPLDGIREVKEALDSGAVNPDDPRTTTLKYYQYLLNAEKVIREVSLDGQILKQVRS